MHYRPAIVQVASFFQKTKGMFIKETGKVRRTLENKILQLSRDGLSTAKKNGFARVDADFSRGLFGIWKFQNKFVKSSTSFYDEMATVGSS